MNSGFYIDNPKLKSYKKNPQPCKEINTLFFHLDIFQGLISPFSIGSLVEKNQAILAWSF